MNPNSKKKKKIALELYHKGLGADRAANYKLAINHFDQAVADYNKAIELKPDFALAYYNRGIDNSALMLKKKAAKDFNSYLKIAGNKFGDADAVRDKIRRLGYKSEF